MRAWAAADLVGNAPSVLNAVSFDVYTAVIKCLMFSRFSVFPLPDLLVNVPARDIVLMQRALWRMVWLGKEYIYNKAMRGKKM